MSDNDDGLGDLFAQGDDAATLSAQVVDYPLQMLAVDRVANQHEGHTWPGFTPRYCLFTCSPDIATLREQRGLTEPSPASPLSHSSLDLQTRPVVHAAAAPCWQPAPLRVFYRHKHHSLWGHKLWNAAKYLLKRIDAGMIDVRGKTVLELGAGLGVPTLAAYANGARLAIATDYPDDDLLHVLQHSVDANTSLLDQETRPPAESEPMVDESRTNEDDVVAASPRRCLVEPLLWGNEAQINRVLRYTARHPGRGDGGEGFDVVLLSDILFNHVCNADLADTLLRTLRRSGTPDSVAYCVFSHHRAHKQVQDLQFFDLCVARGLTCARIDAEDYPLMFPEDAGPAEVRQPVWCYKITHARDRAGGALDLRGISHTVTNSGTRGGCVVAGADGEAHDDAAGTAKPRARLGFDVVISGTGCVQAYLSAALARSGVRVLHCDEQSYYGGPFATLSLTEFTHWLRTHYRDTPSPCGSAGGGGGSRHAARSAWRECAVAYDDTARVCAREARSFAVDVLPMWYMSRGETIRELVRSDMTRHMEFVHMARLCTLSVASKSPVSLRCPSGRKTRTDACVARAGWTIDELPLSRSAVFASSAVSLLDKRRVMKFVKDVEAILAEQHHARNAPMSDRENGQDSDDSSDDAAGTNYTSDSIKSMCSRLRKRLDEADGNVDAGAEVSLRGTETSSRRSVNVLRGGPVLAHARRTCASTLRHVLRTHYGLSDTACDVVTLLGALDVAPHVANTGMCCRRSSRSSGRSDVAGDGPACGVPHKGAEYDGRDAPRAGRVAESRARDEQADALARALHRVTTALRSIAVYEAHGHTPFLLSLYGASEVTQHVCRTSAVWGSVFVLQRGLRGIRRCEEEEQSAATLDNDGGGGGGGVSCRVGAHDRLGEDVEAGRSTTGERVCAVLSNGQHIPTRVIVTAHECAHRIPGGHSTHHSRHRGGGSKTSMPPAWHTRLKDTADPDEEDRDGCSAEEGAAKGGGDDGAGLAWARVVVLSRRPLFTWSMVARSDQAATEAEDATDLPPLLMALTRVPLAPVDAEIATAADADADADVPCTAEALVYVMQHTASSAQTPAESTAAVVHFIADATVMSHEVLLRWVEEHFVRNTTRQRTDLVHGVCAEDAAKAGADAGGLFSKSLAPVLACDSVTSDATPCTHDEAGDDGQSAAAGGGVPAEAAAQRSDVDRSSVSEHWLDCARGEVLLCVAFTLCAEHVAAWAHVSTNDFEDEPTCMSSETRHAHSFAWEQYARLAAMQARQRDALRGHCGGHQNDEAAAVHTCGLSEHRHTTTTTVADVARMQAAPSDCSHATECNRAALCRAMVTVPTLLPNLLDDGAYMECAREAYDAVMDRLIADPVARGRYRFLERLPSVSTEP